MASDVSICNIALTQNGADRILDLLEDSEPARKCKAVYEQFRDEELAAFPWNFAIEYASVALTSTEPDFDYSFAYAVPSDCLRILENEFQEYSFRVVGTKIYSNESSLKVKYIKQITDPNSFSPGFIDVLSSRLAYELSYPLTESATMGARLYEVYKSKRRVARATDSQEGSAPSIIESRWVNARNGSNY